MAMNLDQSNLIFNSIFHEIQQSLSSIQTEEDARFMIIKRILVEALGWEHGEILSEKKSEAGYTDILIKSDDLNRLVIEAKRKDKVLIDTKSDKLNFFKLSGSALSSAQAGIKQARGYCVDHGVTFSVLT